MAGDAAVSRLCRQDLDALDELVRRYQYRLYRYLLRLVNDSAAAEDLFQQTWLQVIRKIRLYDQSREFEPWLYSLARNLCIDHLRRVQPESLDEEAWGGTAGSLEASGRDALRMLLESERATLLNRSLERLPAIYRDVLALRFDEEMRLEAIAEVLGVPLATVKTRLHRALQLLRKEAAPLLEGR